MDYTDDDFNYILNFLNVNNYLQYTRELGQFESLRQHHPDYHNHIDILKEIAQKLKNTNEYNNYPLRKLKYFVIKTYVLQYNKIYEQILREAFRYVEMQSVPQEIQYAILRINNGTNEFAEFTNDFIELELENYINSVEESRQELGRFPILGQDVEAEYVEIEEDNPLFNDANSVLTPVQLLNAAKNSEPYILTRLLSYQEREPLSYDLYNYKKDYYQINELQTSIYDYNELLRWLRTKNTDPITRQIVTSIRKVKLSAPRFSDAVEALGEQRRSKGLRINSSGNEQMSTRMALSRRKTFGGGKTKSKRRSKRSRF